MLVNLQQIIAGLHTAGIKHVSFKPGSVDGIHQVVNIAAANPDFPIILQWTGSRASGYHSYEDFMCQFLGPTALFVSMITSALLEGLALVGWTTFGHT